MSPLNYDVSPGVSWQSSFYWFVRETLRQVFIRKLSGPIQRTWVKTTISEKKENNLDAIFYHHVAVGS